MTKLHEHYEKTVKAAMVEQFGYKNPMQIPRLEKIVVNMGVGEATQDSKKIDAAVEEMTLITGQKPVVNKAKKSVAAFKLREGMTIGCKVTLRRDRMYEFLDRLVTIALPRVRDFRGLPGDSFDGSWQFRDGPEGADRVPRDQLRQGRQDPGYERGDLHHREHRRGGQGSPQGFQHAVQRLSDPRGALVWPRRAPSKRIRSVPA